LAKKVNQKWERQMGEKKEGGEKGDVEGTVKKGGKSLPNPKKK